MDRKSGEQLHTFTHGAGVLDAIFSADGRYILTGSRDNAVRLWDAQTGQLVRQFVGHTNIVQRVTFSPDGSYILSASQDKTARLWDRATGKQVRVFPGHGNAAVSGAVFSPDGRVIAIGSYDGVAQITPTDLPALMQSVCGRLLRDFTKEERTVYGITDQEPTCPHRR